MLMFFPLRFCHSETGYSIHLASGTFCLRISRKVDFPQPMFPSMVKQQSFLGASGLRARFSKFQFRLPANFYILIINLINYSFLLYLLHFQNLSGSNHFQKNIANQLIILHTSKLIHTFKYEYGTMGVKKNYQYSNQEELLKYEQLYKSYYSLKSIHISRQMLLHILILLLIVFLLFLLSVPYLIKASLKKHFSTVQMTLYSPISMRGIFLNGSTDSWGLNRLTIFISAIELGFSPKKFKLSLSLTNFQIFCTRKLISLVPVNLIDGFQEPNILFNIFNYLNTDQTASFRSEKQHKYSSNDQNQKGKSSIHFFLEGSLHLLMLLIMHTVEVKLIDFKGFVVSGLPQQKVSFEDRQKIKKSLMLMQCISEYTVNCDVISVQAKIQHHNNYQVTFLCNQIICNSYLHWKNTFFQVKNIKLQITIPFSLSILKSLAEMNFTIFIQEGYLNLVPTDFDHFFQLLKELFFNLDKEQSSKDNHEQTSSHHVGVFIDLIQISLEDIYEVDYDNRQAKEYLSNVSNATVTLEKIARDDSCFSVEMSTLAVKKYFRENTLSHVLEVLRVPHLTITNFVQSSITEISHDQIIFLCHSQQIALFGKIFSLINSRIRFQNYNQEVYKDFLQTYIKGSTIISEMEKILNNDLNPAEERNQIISKKKSKLIYAPKKVQINIEMVKLRHIITIEGFSYTRFYGYNEMSHEIVINKFLVEHKDIKEFIVTDFRLTFSLTTHQNHLTMMIQNITMNQNQATLIDYLDSFTLFKHLLQFESDEQKKCNKFSKKNISIFQINLNIGKEAITMRSLQINKETHIKPLLDNIYFSLQNCSLLLTKLRPDKQIFRPYVNRDSTILSFSSLSIKQSFELRNGKAKKKINFVLNEPSVTLPQINITSRIIKYIQMYSQLESHLQAYLRNVSNQKLKYLKYHLKQFLQEPPILCIIFTKVKLLMADNKLNNSMLGFSRTIREELSKLHKYNEAEVISILRRNNRNTFMLLETEIDKIRLQLSPIKDLEPQEKSIERWMSQFNQKEQNQKEADKHRIKQVNAGNLEIKFKKIKAKIRDYPISLIDVSFILFQGSMMKLKRIFGEQENYVQGLFNLGVVQLNVGLGWLSGLIEISKRIKQFDVIQKQKNKIGTSLKQKKNFVQKLFQEWNWNLTFKKESKSTLNFLTGNNPYQKQKFQVHIGNIIAQSKYAASIIELENYQLKFRDFDIVLLPKLQLNMLANINKGEFAFDIKVYIPDEIEINMSYQLYLYIEQLGQLRKDWLLIYGIYQQQILKKDVELENIENMNYLQIANLLISRTANHSRKSSFFNLINQIKCRGFFNSIKISIIQEDLELSVLAIKASTFLMIKPNHDLYNRFEVIRSKIQSEKIITLFTKQKLLGETILHSRVPTELAEHLKKKEGKLYPFLTCESICINFNWYFIQEFITGRANVWISIDNVSGEISKKIQRYCLRIANTFENARFSTKRQSVAHKTKPISRLRNAVLSVIQINRRNKIKKGHIKKFKLVIDVHSYQFTLKKQDKQMMLSSLQKGMFLQSIQFNEDDIYHARPEEQLVFCFPDSSISIHDRTNLQSWRQIMTIGMLRIQFHKEKEDHKSDFVNWGHCSFQNISVTLNNKSKSFLDQFIEFIISILNTSEERKRIYRQQTEKYSEMINKRLDRLKQKIQWNQSDLKENQKQLFRWNFLFQQLKIVLQNQNGKFMTAAIDSAKIAMNLFNNTKIDKKIILKNVSIKNQLQSPGSFYQQIMGNQGASLTMFIQTFDVTAFSDVLWKYYRQISLQTEPLKVKMTEELVNCIINFFDKDNSGEQEFESELQEYSDKIPDYIKNLSIKQMYFQLWFKSQSILKRMKGIKVKLEEYQLRQKLYTKKEVRTAWKIWLAKQLASQAFSVLQQKVFGGEKN